jgi:Uma2 family endonuclease
MVAYAKWHYITPEEYLRREKVAETRSEYIDGEIVAMAGASDQHDAIANSIGGELYSHLRPAGCRGYTSNMRVRLNVHNRYYYPDYTIVCGKPEFEVVDGVDSLRNPSVIFEILSPSTERTDRIEKWMAYKRLESLSTYILIRQERPFAEIYSRTPDLLEWQRDEAVGLEGKIYLAPIGYELTLAQIYADVEFPPEPEQE